MLDGKTGGRDKPSEIRDALSDQVLRQVNVQISEYRKMHDCGRDRQASGEILLVAIAIANLPSVTDQGRRSSSKMNGSEQRAAEFRVCEAVKFEQAGVNFSHVLGCHACIGGASP